MKILFSHPTGNANVRAALNGMKQADLLAGFHTSIAVFPDSFLDKLSKLKSLSELQRRQFEPGLQPMTLTHGYKEFGRLIATKAKFSSLVKQETGYFSIDAVYHYIDEAVSEELKKNRGFDAVYSYEDGALESFKTAKKNGQHCLYDLPIGYWRTARKLLEAERLKRPDWANTLIGFNDSAQKLERKDQELALADRIIVASTFTANTLKDYPGKLAPVSVIPYGFPPVVTGRSYANLKARPLKLLFVGGLSQRKGIANLLEAVSSFGNAVSLTIVGHKSVENCKPLNDALATHTWIPSLSHASVLQIMQEHDVFVFPSLFEGFGLVITEAMSQGTPVITTERTAGPDIIDHGENGWLIEAGATEALKEAIEEILIKPELIRKIGEAAMEKARLRPWQKYGQELAEEISKSCRYIEFINGYYCKVLLQINYYYYLSSLVYAQFVTLQGYFKIKEKHCCGQRSGSQPFS